MGKSISNVRAAIELAYTITQLSPKVAKVLGFHSMAASVRACRALAQVVGELDAMAVPQDNREIRVTARAKARGKGDAYAGRGR